MGYLDQHASGLRDDRSTLDEVSELTGSAGTARNLLGGFGFREEMALARVGTLSLGERARLALLKLLLSPNNLLLLGEPTNHLDLPSREQVEAALAGYEAAVLLASHDRYLLRKLCTKVLSPENGALHTYHGGYEDYAGKVGRESIGRAPEGRARESRGPRPDGRALPRKGGGAVAVAVGARTCVPGPFRLPREAVRTAPTGIPFLPPDPPPCLPLYARGFHPQAAS